MQRSAYLCSTLTLQFGITASYMQALFWTGPAVIYTCTHLCTLCWWYWDACFPPLWKAAPLVWTWLRLFLTSLSKSFSHLLPTLMPDSFHYKRTAMHSSDPGCLFSFHHQVHLTFCYTLPLWSPVFTVLEDFSVFPATGEDLHHSP